MIGSLLLGVITMLALIVLVGAICEIDSKIFTALYITGVIFMNVLAIMVIFM